MKLVLTTVLAICALASTAAAQRFNPLEALNQCYQERAQLQIQLNQCVSYQAKENRPVAYSCLVTSNFRAIYNGSGTGPTEALALQIAIKNCGDACAVHGYTQKCDPIYR